MKHVYGRSAKVLTDALARLQAKDANVNLRSLVTQEVAEKLGVGYQAVGHYFTGLRYPKQERVRNGLAELLELTPEEVLQLEMAQVSADGPKYVLDDEPVRALRVRTFIDIQRRYFAPGADIPKKVIVFSGVAPLASKEPMIRRWLEDFLVDAENQDEERQVIYAFPPEETFEKQFEQNFDGIQDIWRHPMFSVVAWNAPRRLFGEVTPEVEKDPLFRSAEDNRLLQTFRDGTRTLPTPRMFAAFGIATTVLAFKFGSGEVSSFATIPVHRSYVDRLRALTDQEHPAALWVRLGSDPDKEIKGDVRVLEQLLQMRAELGEPMEKGLHPVCVKQLLEAIQNKRASESS